MTPQPLPKPSQVLRPYITDPNPRWTHGAWVDYARPGPDKNPGIRCRCQGQILLERASDAGHAAIGIEGGMTFVCRVYAIPQEVFDKALLANDTIDDEDWEAVGGDPISETIASLNALAPKYLGRVIKVYEEAGL